MIYSPLSFATRSAEKPLAAGAAITALGQALVYKMENGRQVVDLSAGAAGEVFAGFSNAQTSATPVTPTSAVKVETLVVPASGVLTVGKTVLAGTVLVTNAATAAPVAVVTAVGTAVDVAAASAGLTVRVVYRYALTAAEARSMVGDVQPGGYSGNSYGLAGVAQQGVIYTDVFDSSKNFAAATAIKLAAGGVLTDQTGAGVAISATVVQVPTTDYPFLGVQYNGL
jgi:hypothetical protein